jgi:hypothetical protein
MVIERMRSDKKNDWAEMFYRSAKLLGDPVSGFEDADLWSVQALVLMSIYTLAISKRNAAYAYYGELSHCAELSVSPLTPDCRNGCQVGLCSWAP